MDVLEWRFAATEARLVAAATDQQRIGRDAIASLEQHAVAGDKFFCRHRHAQAVAQPALPAQAAPAAQPAATPGSAAIQQLAIDRAKQAFNVFMTSVGAVMIAIGVILNLMLWALVIRPIGQLSVPEEGFERSPLRLRFMHAGLRQSSAPTRTTSASGPAASRSSPSTRACP